MFPINHGPVIRRSIVEQHPWVAMNLYHAFLAAKEQAFADMRETADIYTTIGALDKDARKVLDEDALPCGIKANLKTLETVMRYSHEQNLSPRLVSIDEVFAKSTLDF
jgi:4,5-dihydroxyphthalate decarboxylase